MGSRHTAVARAECPQGSGCRCGGCARGEAVRSFVAQVLHHTTRWPHFAICMACLRASTPNGASVDVMDSDVAKWFLQKVMCEPKSAVFSGPLQPPNAPLVPIYLDKLISHATGINDERCFGAILDHLAAKKRPRRFCGEREIRNW